MLESHYSEAVKLFEMYRERDFDKDFEHFPDIAMEHKATYDALMEFCFIGGHQIVPRAWLEQFSDELITKGKTFPAGAIAYEITMEDITDILEPEFTGWWKGGPFFASLNRYYADHDMKYQLWSGTLDYGATGEGRTLGLIAGEAYAAGDFLLKNAHKLGSYFTFGLRAYKGLPPKTDDVAKFLLTPAMRKDIEQSTRANVDVLISHHVNFS